MSAISSIQTRSKACIASSSLKANTRGKQRRDVLGQAARELFQHALLGHRAGDRLAFECQVMIEARDELVRIQRELFKSVMQIEQVAVLAPLQQRAQLGAEQFFGLEGRNLGLALGTSRFPLQRDTA